MSDRDLKHIIVLVVKEENLVGGIAVSALVSRVQAQYATEKAPIPSDEGIRMNIFNLLAADALVYDGFKLKATEPKPKVTQPPTWADSGGNPSGMHPIGVGDKLYNAAGLAVAEVVGLRRQMALLNGSKRIVVCLDVEALFSSIQAYDGTTIPGRGEVIGAKKTT